MADTDITIRHNRLTLADGGGLGQSGDGKLLIEAESLESVLRVRVYNATGVGLADNALVYVSGAYAPAGADEVRTVALADLLAATPLSADYIVDGVIGIASYGYVKRAKDVGSLVTGATQHAPVYGVAAGAWSLTPPTTDDRRQIVGHVKVASGGAATGSIAFALTGDTLEPHTHADAARGGQLTLADAIANNDITEAVAQAKINNGALTEAVLTNKLAASSVEGTKIKLSATGALTGNTGAGADELGIGDGTLTRAVCDAKVATGAIQPGKLGLFARNATGGNFAAGDLVYVNGWDAGAGRVTIDLAQNDAAGQKAQYVCVAAINAGADGMVAKKFTHAGVINTAAVAPGSPLYLSATGTTTNTVVLVAPNVAGQVSQIVGRTRTQANPGDVEFELDAQDLAAIGTNEMQPLSVTPAILADASVTPGKLDGVAYVANTNIISPTYTITRQFAPGDFDVNDVLTIYAAGGSPAIYVVKAEVLTSTVEAITVALRDTAAGGGTRISGDIPTAVAGGAQEGANTPAEADRVLAADGLFLHASANPATLVGTLIIEVRGNV